MQEHKNTRVWSERRTIPSGATVLELLLAGGLVFGVVFAFQMIFFNTNAESRDLRRLMDMRQAETVFQRLYRSTGGFLAAAQDGGCSETGSLLSSCNFSRLGERVLLRDPGNSAYRVTVAPTETNFEITFTLEQAHGTLAAGDHTLSPSGIR